MLTIFRKALFCQLCLIWCDCILTEHINQSQKVSELIPLKEKLELAIEKVVDEYWGEYEMFAVNDYVGCVG